MILTTMPAIVRINVPFIKDSPFVDLLSSSSIAVTAFLFSNHCFFYIMNMTAKFQLSVFAPYIKEIIPFLRLSF